MIVSNATETQYVQFEDSIRINNNKDEYEIINKPTTATSTPQFINFNSTTSNNNSLQQQRQNNNNNNNNYTNSNHSGSDTNNNGDNYNNPYYQRQHPIVGTQYHPSYQNGVCNVEYMELAKKQAMEIIQKTQGLSDYQHVTNNLVTAVEENQNYQQMQQMIQQQAKQNYNNGNSQSNISTPLLSASPILSNESLNISNNTVNNQLQQFKQQIQQIQQNNQHSTNNYTEVTPYPTTTTITSNIVNQSNNIENTDNNNNENLLPTTTITNNNNEINVNNNNPNDTEPLKKKRGRPPKNKELGPVSKQTAAQLALSNSTDNANGTKRTVYLCNKCKLPKRGHICMKSDEPDEEDGTESHKKKKENHNSNINHSHNSNHNLNIINNNSQPQVDSWESITDSILSNQSFNFGLSATPTNTSSTSTPSSSTTPPPFIQQQSTTNQSVNINQINQQIGTSSLLSASDGNDIQTHPITTIPNLASSFSTNYGDEEDQQDEYDE